MKGNGCLFWGVLVVVVIIWMRYYESVEDKKRKEYHKIYLELQRPVNVDTAIVKWEAAYQNSTNNNERRECKSRLIKCYEQKGLLKEALALLKEFEDEFEKSNFTAYHRACIYVRQNKLLKARKELDSVIALPIVFKEPSFLRKIWMYYLDYGDGDNMKEYYHDYFANFTCLIVALTLRASLENNEKHRVQILKLYFKYALGFEEVVANYLDFQKQNPKSHSYMTDEKYKIMQETHLNSMYNYVNFYNPIDDLFRLKWNYFTDLMLIHDKVYGYKQTVNFFNKVNPIFKSATEGYQRFLYKAYMQLGKSKKLSMVDHDFFQKVEIGCWGWLVKLTPQTNFGKESAFLNAGMTKPVILIKCNDWNIHDNKLFSFDNIRKDKGKPKRIVVLKDDYTTDTLSIYADNLGVEIDYRIVPFTTLKLLRSDFARGK